LKISWGSLCMLRFVKLDSQIISGKTGGLFLLRPLKGKKIGTA